MPRSKKYIRSFVSSVLLVGSFAITADFCQKKTKGFRLQNIYPSMDSQQCFSLTSSQEKEIEQILAQPFFFFKKGQQCFTFSSKDGKYILKLFRWDKLELPHWTKYLPSSFIGPKRESLQRKKTLDFASYMIAIHELKEETGLIYLCLGKNGPIHLPLEIYDNIGIRHVVSTKDIGFMIQKKAEDFFPYFQDKLNKEKEEELKPFLTDLIKLIQSRVNRQIADSDISLEYNMGIIDGKPLLFDIGNLQKKQTSIEEEIKLIIYSLEKKAPSLAAFFKQQVNDIAQERDHSIPLP